MKECPGCGETLLNDAVLCPECGSRWLADGAFLASARTMAPPAATPSRRRRRHRTPHAQDALDAIFAPAPFWLLPTPVLVATAGTVLVVGSLAMAWHLVVDRQKGG